MLIEVNILDLFDIFSILFIWYGTYLLSKNLFIQAIKNEYMREEFRYPEAFWKRKLFLIYGFRNHSDVSKLFQPDYNKGKDFIKKYKNHFDPVYGFLFVTLGIIVQIFKLIYF